MTHFKIVSGFDCGVDKSVCKLGYPEYCPKCIADRLREANIIMDIIEVTEQYSEQKRKEMLYRHIWMKYQDVLNIRHVIILTDGGLPAFNMAVMDLPIDASLISGFIQANVAFSNEDLTLMDGIKKEKEFYEFEYKNFHILLKLGQYCKICLILENKASSNLKELLSNFSDVFEEIYKDKLQKFNTTGDLDLLNPVRQLVEKSFEVTMKYPLTLSSLIPPDVIDNLSLIQKAIYECIKDLLKDTDYFFIPTLIDVAIKFLSFPSKEEVLWQIYQLMREKIIVWKEPEYERFEIEEEQKKKEKIFKNLRDSKDLEEIFFESGQMSEAEALVKIKSLINRGDLAVKNAAYEEAIHEYQKAHTYAKEFHQDDYISKILVKILEVKELNKDVELKFAIELLNKSEKKKDYVIALKYLFQIQNILSSDNEDQKHDKQLKKIEFRIKKIQDLIKHED